MDSLDNNKKIEICDLVMHTQMPFRYKLGLDKNITFGTEIEFENARKESVRYALSQKRNLEKWKLVNEVSVESESEYGPCGGELVSPILNDNKKNWHQLRAACHLIRQNLGLNLGKSAAHIHIGANILNHDITYVTNLVKLWTVYEHVIYRFSYGEDEYERKTIKQYGSPLAPYFNEALLYLKKDNPLKYFSNFYDFFASFHNPSVIKASLCFYNSDVNPKKEKNTIEVRCPNGTLNEKIWQNNINFFTKLMLYARSADFDDEFIENKLKNFQRRTLTDYREIYFDDAIELSNLIFNDELDKLYFLKQYLKVNEINFETIKTKVIENK